MAGTYLALSARRALLAAVSKQPTSINAALMSSYTKSMIGKREVVGYGFNGEPNYLDRPDFPMPAIRWREPTSDICALREKEKGDWNKLSLEEKKALYRASFCQTFAEFQAPTGQWKSIIGCGLMLMSMSFWVLYALKAFVYPERPISFSQEHKEAQLRRIIDLQMNPIEGLASTWDYDKNDWKRNTK